MTQFYVPFTVRHEEVTEAAPPGTIFVDVSDGPDAYWGALRDIWAKGESFALIEHDVVCRPDAVEQFDSCPEPWCTFGYDPICHPECQEAWANQLGCTRFRSDVMAKCPDALISIPDDRRVWNNLCDEIAGNKIGGVDQPILRPASLRAVGFTHHWHFPPVRHISWEGHARGRDPRSRARRAPSRPPKHPPRPQTKRTGRPARKGDTVTMAPRTPAAKATTAKVDPSAETLVEIAKLVRHPEAAEHGGRNRYKREALVQIAELTKDVVVPGEPEPEVEDDEDAEEETEPDEAA